MEEKDYQGLIELMKRWRMLEGFMEHLIAGTVFIAMALYWIKITTLQIYKAQKNNEPFVSILWNVSSKKYLSPHNIFFYIFICLTFLPFFISINYFTWQFEYYLEFHHIAIYSCFCLHFIAVNFQSKNNVWGLLYGDYITLTISCYCHSILIGFHFVGENSSAAVHIEMHILLLINIVLLTLFFILEMVFRNSLIIAIFRSYIALVYGTWLCNIGFVQFPIIPYLPIWDMNSNFSQIMIAVLYVENVILDFVIVLIYIHFLLKRIRRCDRFDSKENSFETEKLL